MKRPVRSPGSTTAEETAGGPPSRAPDRPGRGATFARRLHASYLTATVVALAVLLVPLGWVFARYEYEDLAAQAIVAGEGFSDVAGGPLARGETEGLQRLAAAYATSIGGTLTVFDASGRLVAEAKQHADHPTALDEHPDVIAALRGQRVSGPTSYECLTSSISIATPVLAAGEIVGAIDIIMPTAGVERRIRMVWGALGVFSLGMLGAVAALGGSLSNWTLRPLRRLQWAARSWAEGETTARARLDSGPAELRELGETFDLMADYVGGLLDAHRTALAEASHELRLPLTAYRLRLANLEPFVAAEERHRIEDLDRNLVTFQRRLDRLVGLAWDQPKDLRQPVDVRRAVIARHVFWSPTAEQRGVQLLVEACGGSSEQNLLACEVSGSLEEILDNLIANALAASPAGSTVRLSVVPGRDSIDVHVVDQGPGMSPESRQQAMEAFLRSKRANASGGGLGLAIVQQLAKAMEGAVELRAAEHGGLDAVVRLRPIDELRGSDEGCGTSSGCRAYGCARLENTRLGDHHPMPPGRAPAALGPPRGNPEGAAPS
jgi:signal transduction histidine kinase